MTDATNVRRGRSWQPVALVLLFLGPLALALILYYGGDRWRPAGGTNLGILIQPPLLMPQLRAPQSDAESDAADLRGRWTILYIDSGTCDARCEEALYRGAQTREALGRRMTRVERLYVHRGPAPPPATPGTTDALRMIAGDEAQGRQLLEALPAEFLTGDDLLLVDPLGNLMMRFPLDRDRTDMLTDLRKLLKLSRIG